MLQAAQPPSAVRGALEGGVNVALRGLTLASKFLLLVQLARVLAPEQVGVYGLFTVTVSYALYLLGLDFYTYAQREMFALPPSQWGALLRTQLAFYGTVYLVMFPVLLLVFLAGWLPWQMAGWFYLILTLEHLSQELSRLLVVCGRVTLANLALFFRGGAWILALLALSQGGAGLGLGDIWAGWSVGVALSIAVALSGVRALTGPLSLQGGVDWTWIRRGLKVAAQFLLGTLALRALFTFDRYLLDLYAGKSLVGVYTFFMNIAGALLAFADAGVISKCYPRIVAAYRTGKFEEYRLNLRRMAQGILVLFALFALGLCLSIEPVLGYIGREAYSAHSATLWLLVAAIGLFCLGLVPHYALYARDCDRAIAAASIAAVLLFLAGALWLTPQLGLTGMALAVLLGMASLGGIKLCLLSRLAPTPHIKQEQQSDPGPV